MKISSSYKKRSIFAVLLTLALLVGVSFPPLSQHAAAVSQSDLDALKQKEAQLAEQKAALKKQSDENSNKMHTQTDKLNLLTAQLKVTNSELDNLSEQITIYTNEIARMENELNDDIQKEQELLGQYKIRMREMEENGTISYISIIFQANSFSDLLSRVDTVQAIMEHDSTLVKNVQAAEANVKAAQKNMTAEMAAQENVFAEFKDKQKDLETQKTEAATVLASLTTNSADYKQQLQSLTTLQSSLNTQINSIADKLAEQERIRAEQAAAAKAAAAKAAAAKAASFSRNWYKDAAGSGTGTGQDIVNYAESFLGVPYVYGGTDPSGFDCSGLVYYCYTHFGYSVNRTATSLSYNGRTVSASELKAGDVIIFTEEDSSGIGHCGIYIGGGEFIHAPHTGDIVKISSLASGYYAQHFWGARRIIG